MKQEQKNNVTIKTIEFWTEHDPKENLLFSFVVPFLTLFFAVAGLVGSFVTAFSVQTIGLVLYVGLLLYSLFWTGFSRLKMEGVYRFLAFIAAMVAASVLLLFMQNKAISGFFQVANGVYETLNVSYEGNIVLYQVSANPQAATVFLLFLMFPVSGLLSFGIVKKQNVWGLAAVAFPVIFGAWIAGGVTGKRYLFFLLLAFLGLMVESSMVEPFAWEKSQEQKRQETHYQEIKSKVLLGSAIPVLLISLISLVVLRPALTSAVYLARETAEEAEGGVLQALWSVLPAVSGGHLEMTMEGVGGGVDEGNLGKTEGFNFGNMQALKVTCDTKPDETLYLKGYVGSVYTGNSFGAGSEESFVNAAYSWKTEGDPTLYVQNLPFLRMMYAENLILSDTEEEDPQMAEELTSTAVELQVENLNANEAYTYVPYNAYLNDYYDVLAGDGAVASQNRAEDIFSYYPRSVFEERMTEWADEEDAHGVLDSVEASYESYVRNKYLQIPETGLEQLQAECEAADIDTEDVDEIREYVVQSLTENTTFSMDVESLPEGKDFVTWFLYEKKEGYSIHYAAAATMMFRMFGVPARYVVGYVAPDSLFAMQADGSYVAILEDDNAHAWTEIYLSGIGWVPVETTPGFVAMVAEGNGDPGVNGTEQNNEETEETQETDEETGDADDADNAGLEDATANADGISVWLKAVLIACGCIVLGFVIAVIRRNYFIQKRTGHSKRLDTAGNIKYLYLSLRSLITFDGWMEAPGCEAEEFAKAFAEKYPVCSEEEMESLAMMILQTCYGRDERSDEELHFLMAIYRRVGSSVYERSSFGKRILFKWWKCYM